MQCSKCGRKLKADMTVCPSCGTGINGETSIKDSKKTKEIKNDEKNKEFLAKALKWAAIALIAVSAAIVVCLLTLNLTEDLREYNAVMKLYENEQYDEAEVRLQALADKDYRDSKEKLKQMRVDWIIARTEEYDFLGAQKYIKYLFENESYINDLNDVLNYETAQLHEEENPIIAKYYYEQAEGYLDADQKAEEMAVRAEQIGQTLADFSNPKPGEEDWGKTLYYKISLKSFDTEEEANQYREQVISSGDSITPFVEELDGKWRVLASTHTDRKEAETIILSLKKMGYEPETITDWMISPYDSYGASDWIENLTGIVQN